jgi:nucleoside 2-deoxyribosyltransferase
MARVYCAGPLFNDVERQEMAQIAQALEEAGFATFLPQRDGLEFSRLLPVLQGMGVSLSAADAMLQRAIFSLDVYELLAGADAVVANLNGRVPDEGTVVEASLAWHAGKPLVLYKDDARSLLNGADNPMLTGLGGFTLTRTIAAIPNAVHAQLQIPQSARVAAAVETGRQIARERQALAHPAAVAKMLLTQFSHPRNAHEAI